MTQYIIKDLELYQEGGSVEFYCLKHYPTLGFKQFKSKRLAIDAHKRQRKLSKFNLAPKVCTDIRQLKISRYNISGWGFVTEKALILDEHIMLKRLDEIQNLVDNIYEKTGWKFWDCHYYNIGYVKRKNKRKLVCIDTGGESFSCDGNAWGNPDPGPKCSYCLKYMCNCE